MSLGEFGECLEPYDGSNVHLTLPSFGWRFEPLVLQGGLGSGQQESS
jgi:hypothetical protein